LPGRIASDHVLSYAMEMKRAPELLAFFSTYLTDSDIESDSQSAQSFVAASSIENRSKVVSQLKALIAEGELPIDEFGAEANRWFGDSEEARAWLESLLAAFETESEEVGGDVVVKDSNGAVLLEGDSVQVIKDLKVKGGSSDLKRGTLIKKIHLIGDPGNIECRVDGSTLVLKTMFLKKA
jgi:protein PhnA